MWQRQLVRQLKNQEKTGCKQLVQTVDGFKSNFGRLFAEQQIFFGTKTAFDATVCQLTSYISSNYTRTRKFKLIFGDVMGLLSDKYPV